MAGIIVLVLMPFLSPGLDIGLPSGPAILAQASAADRASLAVAVEFSDELKILLIKRRLARQQFLRFDVGHRLCPLLMKRVRAVYRRSVERPGEGEFDLVIRFSLVESRFIPAGADPKTAVDDHRLFIRDGEIEYRLSILLEIFDDRGKEPIKETVVTGTAAFSHRVVAPEDKKRFRAERRKFLKAVDSAIKQVVEKAGDLLKEGFADQSASVSFLPMLTWAAANRAMGTW